MMEFTVPGLLVMAGLVLAIWTYSLARQQRAAELDAMLSASGLYESGQGAARAKERTRFTRVAAYLHRAGLEIAPELWMAKTVALGVVAFSLATALSGGVAFGSSAAGAVVLGSLMRVEASRRARRASFDRQFVRVLPQLAASVRSSLTLERAVRVAASHVEEPLREELARVLADAAYGTTLTEAFEGMAQRTGNPDAKALAAAIRIQQRFGGAIAPVLDMIADHANARLRAARELRTELAGTRLAKWFVAASMPAIFLIMFVTNTDFARFYQQEPLGWALICAAAAFEAVGLAACHQITKMEGGGE